MSDSEMGRNMAEAKSHFEKGNQAEGRDCQTQRQTKIQGTRQRGKLLPRTLALPLHPLTYGRSLHPVPSHSRTSSRMRSCFGRSWGRMESMCRCENQGSRRGLGKEEEGKPDHRGGRALEPS